ncbi:MAG TPA: tetratricopeptide repeat protein [bacterium]|nr:tetratricopeptide repeat protein [bacterium]
MFSARCTGPASRLPWRGSAGHWLLAIVLAALLVLSCHKPPAYKEVVAVKEGYTHVIAQGETLESIAEKYYGDAKLGRALGEYNKLDPLRPLEPGVTLLIPFDTTELEKITKVNEGYVSYNRGTMLARTGQYEQAIPYLEKAVETDPSNADAWFNLGVTYEKMGRLDKALPVLERLTGARPAEKTYQYSYGSVLRKLNRKKDALGAFKAAIKLDDKYKEAQYALALTYEDLGKTNQARDAWQRYLELDPDSAWGEEARIHLDSLGGR